MSKKLKSLKFVHMQNRKLIIVMKTTQNIHKSTLSWKLRPEHTVVSVMGRYRISVSLSTTNPTWTDPDLCAERPATNRLSHGTAFFPPKTRSSKSSLPSSLFNPTFYALLISPIGLAMAQALSSQPLTIEAWVRARVSPCGICGGQSSTGTGFSLISSVGLHDNN
jgi:hypothetical protein